MKWHVQGHQLPVQERVLIMGVLNVTPDSFSDGGRYPSPEAAVAQALDMEAAGADLVDIGGESSRPGARPVSLAEELTRVVPVIKALSRRLHVPMSIDTTKAEVARRGLEAGAVIINDISALRHDPGMAEVVARAQAGVILMHMRGIPETMHHDPSYSAVVEEVCEFLQDRVEAAVAAGIERERIAIDPGLGFGKTGEHNLTLMAGLSALRTLGRPIVIGPSRKAFVGGVLERPVDEREWGTAAAVAIGVYQGAHVVRVHAVSHMREVARMAQAIRDIKAHPAVHAS